MARKLSAADALVDILDREGVTHVFGVPGGPILGLCDAIQRHPRLQLVLTKHEQGAAYAAFAFAQSTGRLGVCIATLGPGATNLLAGLPVAAVEGTPVLAITGEVQLDGIGHGAHQESSGWFGTPNQNAMFDAVCKKSYLCVDSNRLPHFARHAIRLAHSGRPGPVHLMIPSGLFHEKVAYAPLSPAQYRLTASAAVDEAAAARIAARIASARAPVLLLGARSARPSCGAAAEALSSQALMPLAADLSCKSVVDERHPHYLGCLGVLGHRAAEQFVKQSADLIVSVGQTFDEISTLGWDPAFAENRSLIQLDFLEDEIGKVFPISDGSAGCLPALLERIASHLPTLPEAAADTRRSLIAQTLKRNPPFEAGSGKVRSPMPPPSVVEELQAGLPDDAILLSDSSKWSRWIGRFFQARRGQMVSAHDYEPMGWAVAGALGVKVAHPDRPVVCLSGDGAFLMSAMELSAAVNHEINVVWLVMNDERLGIIYDLQKTLFNGRLAATTFANPDLVAFAQAMGLEGRRVSEPGELRAALAEACRAPRSSLIDIRFDPDVIPALRPRSVLITKGMGLPDPTPGPETTRALISMLKDR